MIIIPAIDLKKSKVVRLYQGDFEKVTSYTGDPVDLVKDFITKGARRIHVICLMGAKDGKIYQEDEETIRKIIETRNVFASHCEYRLAEE